MVVAAGRLATYFSHKFNISHLSSHRAQEEPLLLSLVIYCQFTYASSGQDSGEPVHRTLAQDLRRWTSQLFHMKDK